MKLIAGLGNIGKEYEGTRHNSGFMLVDHIAEEFGVSWKAQPKFKAIIAEIGIGGQKIVLVKPTTYYNRSGEALWAVSDFYKLETMDILIIHDELALPFGTLRTRTGGSDAGNNGIKNITEHLGPYYARIRVGIANDHLNNKKAEQFVLEKFNKDEVRQLPALANNTIHFVEDFIHDDKEFAHTSITTNN